jgi:hypothetical protein
VISFLERAWRRLLEIGREVEKDVEETPATKSASANCQRGRRHLRCALEISPSQCQNSIAAVASG